MEENELELPEEALAELGGGNVEVPEDKVEEQEDENILVPDEEEGAGSESTDDLSNVATLNAKLLMEAGLLDDVEGIKSMDDILSKVRQKNNSVIDEYISELPMDIAEQIKAFEKGLNHNAIKESVSAVASLDKLADKDIKENAGVAEKLYKELMEAEGEDAAYI